MPSRNGDKVIGTPPIRYGSVDCVEDQMQSGSVHSIGWALNEEYFYSDDGYLDNSSYLDYRIPTALDLPMIETIIIEIPNPGHPYNVRGIGEANIAPLQPTLANALGVRPQELPR